MLVSSQNEPGVRSKANHMPRFSPTFAASPARSCWTVSAAAAEVTSCEGTACAKGRGRAGSYATHKEEKPAIDAAGAASVQHGDSRSCNILTRHCKNAKDLHQSAARAGKGPHERHVDAKTSRGNCTRATATSFSVVQGASRPDILYSADVLAAGACSRVMDKCCAGFVLV